MLVSIRMNERIFLTWISFCSAAKLFNNGIVDFFNREIQLRKEE
jgi:hypothetical protein